MLAPTNLPTSHGALIQAKGGDDGLARAAMTEQRQHQSHHLRAGLQAIERRVFGGREGLATGLAKIAISLSAMHLDIALSRLPSGRTIEVVAKLVLRVHRWCPEDVIGCSRLQGCTINPYSSSI